MGKSSIFAGKISNESGEFYSLRAQILDSQGNYGFPAKLIIFVTERI
ncbi:hypothetical protein [Metasolibacillus sp. FSL K6-0083]